MNVKHKICINISEPEGRASPVAVSETAQVRKRLLNFLLGDKVNALVLSPGNSVETVEIREIKACKLIFNKKLIFFAEVTKCSV